MVDKVRTIFKKNNSLDENLSWSATVGGMEGSSTQKNQN
jgi:hypothetical protein